MSEPFGLFHFLQSLLPINPSNEPTPTENSDSPPTDGAVEHDAKAVSPAPADAPNACLSFLQAHENRAKNLRKK